ncbi:MAG: SUF system NifU family Fe-S cluster assembly protein [archaeon]|nr:SUF system NifU family Fe-S cluster assembly protein [archaeon]
MSFSDDPQFMREVMTDHIHYPRNKRIEGEGYVSVHMASSSCIDDVHVQLKLKDDVIEDLCWHGTGCSISCASCSIMTELLKGKTRSEALKLADTFDCLMRMEPCDEDSLEEADCFANVPREPARINCAKIGWKGLRKALGQEVNE